MKRLIFKIRFSPGDILMFSAALADLHQAYPKEYLTDVRSPAPEIFENNPNISSIMDEEADYQLMIQYEMIHQSGQNGRHFSEGFRQDLSERLGLIDYMSAQNNSEINAAILEYLTQGTAGNKQSISKITKLIKEFHIAKVIPSSSIRPQIFLTQDEKNWTNQVAADFGYAGKFWLINAGWKNDCELKKYPYWQEVVDILSDHIQIVQIGHKTHNHPELKGAFNLIGKTDTRQLIRLCHHAQGSLGPVTFLMVLAAAFKKPYVCIAGGREGPRWQMYPDHAYLKTHGWLACCPYDGCWKHLQKECANMAGGVPRCMKLITPEEVAEACLKYYKGGRLQF